ncbi:MAG: site-2 protease family protein [Parachlamydiales bacterium]|nr:site-2 protease family protein [Parachlamydiales bacterium]
MLNILYIILAIIGLGILVFIHELGHYFVAKRKKMKIETFSIGFGKPIFSWMRGDVKWQIGVLPFGGFVKIAGMQKEGNLEPYQIEDGFFSKKPIDRICVALAGPFTNLVFAFLIFSVIWALGGRNKNFAEFTKKIGYVDTKSELYDLKVRPGDEILEYNKKKYSGFKDVLYTSLTNGKEIEISGYKISYSQGKKIPFDYTLAPYPDPDKAGDFTTIGVLAPASYLIYSKVKGFDYTSPIIQDSGLQYNDRVLWANGEILFSLSQLNDILNENQAFLTIKRKDKIFHTKVNLIKAQDLKLPPNYKNDILDWKYYENIKPDFDELQLIPYAYTSSGYILEPLDFLSEKAALSFKNNRNAYAVSLEKGDRILAIGSKKIDSGSKLLNYLQNPQILLIVQRNGAIFQKISYKNEDLDFNQNLNIFDLNKLISNIGTPDQVSNIQSLHLLKPITPITRKQLAQTSPIFKNEYERVSESISKIKDEKKKQEANKAFQKFENNKVLGIHLQDRSVKYNPNPVTQFVDVFKEIYRTLVSLISGYLSPKYLAGPVGIIHVVKTSWSLGASEALYWLAVISLNLGFFNLLPLPVLDGGHILFSIIEMITKKPIKSKTMEKLVIPFVILLIGFIIFITYNDVLRIFKKFF